MLELAKLQEACGETLQESTFRDNRRIVVLQGCVYSLLELLHRNGCDMLAEMTAVDYLEYEGATDRFGLIYVLVNTATGERLDRQNVLEPARAGVAECVSALAIGRLAGARSVRHVRHRVHRPPRPAADLDAGRVYRFPAAERLPAQRPRRAAQLPGHHPRRKLKSFTTEDTRSRRKRFIIANLSFGLAISEIVQ